MEMEDEEFLPDGIGSDIEDHAISSSDDNASDGTPRMSPNQMGDFDPEQDIGALLGNSSQQQDDEEEGAGPSYLTSSFLSMPENVSKEDLHVKKAKDTAAGGKGGKKRGKRKAPKEDKDEGSKKKKKKSKKEGGKKKDKKGKGKDAAATTPAEKHKRRNIK